MHYDLVEFIPRMQGISVSKSIVVINHIKNKQTNKQKLMNKDHMIISIQPEDIDWMNRYKKDPCVYCL